MTSTPVLAFPVAPEQQAPQSSEGRRVETTPAVGYHAVTLTYYDAEHIPRISVTLDETVPDHDAWRRWIKRAGDALGPRSPARAPLFGPRLLP